MKTSGKRAIGMGAIGMGAIGMGAIGMGAIGMGAISMGAIGMGAISMGAIGMGPSAWGHRHGAIGMGAIGMGAIGMGAIGMGAIGMGTQDARRNRYPVAVHLFFMCDERVLLARRWGTGWHDGEYSVPAGHVEAGETVTAAARREAGEEVGVTLRAADVAVVHVMHRRDGADGDERVDFFLHVRAWAGELRNAEPEKCDELRWCAPADLPANTIPYIRHALACWRAGVAYSEHGWGVVGG